MNIVRGADSGLLNDVIVLSGHLKDLQRRERRATEDPQALQRERNAIFFSLLEVVTELRQANDTKKALFPTATVTLQPPPDNSLEKIFGVNHLKSIAWLQRGLNASRSVCRVVTPLGAGTGFMIDGGRVVTNHHVLMDREIASESRLEFGYEDDVTGRLSQSVTSYSLDSATYKSNEPLDCAIVSVAPNPKYPDVSTWGVLVPDFRHKPSVGQHVTIIQHPEGGPKQIAITANQVVNVFGHRLQYTTDTLPGSSGSPVFDDRWSVIAVHHAGGNLVKNDRGDRMFANEGILVSALASLLSS